MALQQNTATRATKNYPVDDRFMFWDGTDYRPYADVAEANGAIVASRRHVGLIIIILQDYYTYKTGVTNSDLVPLTAGGGGGSSSTIIQYFTFTPGQAASTSITLPAYQLIEKIIIKTVSTVTIVIQLDGQDFISESISGGGFGVVFSVDIVAFAVSRVVEIFNIIGGAEIVIIKRKLN